MFYEQTYAIKSSKDGQRMFGRNVTRGFKSPTLILSILSFVMIPGWWFGTFFFSTIYGMSSFPLTNSIIFQDGEIAPPTRYRGLTLMHPGTGPRSTQLSPTPILFAAMNLWPARRLIRCIKTKGPWRKQRKLVRSQPAVESIRIPDQHEDSSHGWFMIVSQDDDRKPAVLPAVLLAVVRSWKLQDVSFW